MPLRLEGRLVLITGASSGIGRTAAGMFSDAGAHVVAVARNRDALDSLASEREGRIDVEVCDVTSSAAVDEMAGRVIASRGVPDVVIANAGLGLDARVTETTDEAMRGVFEVNVFGVMRTIRAFLPGMLSRKRGRVLLVSSIVGKRGIPNYSVYSASKFALHGIADALSTELVGTGVTVGVICPASTDSGFHERALQSGPAQRRVRPRRHGVESVARALMEMAVSRRRERILGIEAKLLVLADTLSPRGVDRLLARTLNPKKDD